IPSNSVYGGTSSISLHTAPPELDPFAEATIRLANPAYDGFLNRREVLAMAEAARRMPARQAEYENLILNRRTQAFNPFISPLVWKGCDGSVASLEGIPVYGGAGLSSVGRRPALVLFCLGRGRWG